MTEIQSMRHAVVNHASLPVRSLDEIEYLSTPTIPQQRPLLDSWDFFIQGFEEAWYFLRGSGGVGGTAEEIVQFLLFLRVIGRKYLQGSWVAVEQVGDEDLNFPVRLSVRQDIGPLLHLRAQAEDVVNDENGRRCRGITGVVWCNIPVSLQPG